MNALSAVMVTVWWILAAGYTLLLCWLPKRLTKGKEVEVEFGWRFQGTLVVIELVSLIIREISQIDGFLFLGLILLMISILGSFFYRYQLAVTKRDATWRICELEEMLQLASRIMIRRLRGDETEVLEQRRKFHNPLLEAAVSLAEEEKARADAAKAELAKLQRIQELRQYLESDCRSETDPKKVVEAGNELERLLGRPLI